MQPTRSWIKDQILILLNQSPKHGYDLLHILKESVPNLRLTTLYRWLHDMESKSLVHSVILPGPYGPNRRMYRIGLMGEKRLSELIGNSVQMVMQFYSAFEKALSNRVNLNRDEETPNGRILFTAVPHLKKEDLDVLFFLSMRCNNSPIEILGKHENIEDLGIKYRSVKGSIFELSHREGPYNEIWLKGIPELDNLPSAIQGCKKALSSKGVLFVIVPIEPAKESHDFSIREYIHGKTKLSSKEDKIHNSDVGLILKEHFATCGSIDLIPGLDVYYCIK